MPDHERMYSKDIIVMPKSGDMHTTRGTSPRKKPAQ
jgi:hypothetical protein